MSIQRRGYSKSFSAPHHRHKAPLQRGPAVPSPPMVIDLVPSLLDVLGVLAFCTAIFMPSVRRLSHFPRSGIDWRVGGLRRGSRDLQLGSQFNVVCGQFSSLTVGSHRLPYLLFHLEISCVAVDSIESSHSPPLGVMPSLYR